MNAIKRNLFCTTSTLSYIQLRPTAWPIIGNGHKMLCDANGEAKKSS